VGGFLRLGENIPVDFGPQRIRALAGGSGYYKPTQLFGWYVYGGVAGTYEPHNIFLDGSLFQSTPEVDKNDVFGQAYVGFACYHGPTRLGLTLVSESERFDAHPESGVFGAFNVTWRL